MSVQAKKNIFDLLLIGPLPPPEGGVRVSFAQLANDLQDSLKLETKLVDLTVPKRGVCFRFLAYLKKFQQIICYLKTAKVVSFQAPNKYINVFGPLVYIMARLYRCPIVLRRFAGDCDKNYMEQNLFIRWVLRKTILNSDLSFYQTHYQVKFFSGLGTKPVKWFPTNRPTPPLKKESFSCTARKFIFLGWVMEEKGILTLLQAFDLLEDNVCLDIYGADLMDIRSRLKGTSRVRYQGVIAHSEVYRLLVQYDALVLPSYWKGEGYPGVVIEALLVNLPVIASNLPGIAELVKHEQTGLLVDPQDAKSLKNAISRLHRDGQLYEKIISEISQNNEMFSSEYWTQEFEKTVLSFHPNGNGAT